MRGNWKCTIRWNTASALGMDKHIPGENLGRVIHAKNTSREAAVDAAIVELLPEGLPIRGQGAPNPESLIACEPDDTDWPTTH
jgi:hypothetical protein